ncbi:MAG: AI-2E family transporter [Acidobacteriota bacterium]
MREIRFRQAFLIVLVVGVTIAFVAMIQTFLLTILMAAIFSGAAYPAYRRLRHLLGGRQVLASLTTIVLLLALVLVPLGAVMAAIANQALRVSDNVRPRLQRMIKEPGELTTRLRSVPGFDRIEPYREQILAKAGELVGNTGSLLVKSISATTVATAVFFFQFIVMLYTMFFFLIGGPGLLRSALAYLPLSEGDKERMIERFVSVTRATLKGSVLIGVAQGTLAGLAFWAVGIDGALFWGAMMAVLSIIPGIGGALVWVPTAIVLVTTGEVWRGVGLAIFCGLGVGSVDNVLRPILVGRDTQMHELMIFFSTLGGLLVFGAMGFIVGPILAALFLTAWEMFGSAFRSELAAPESVRPAPERPPPAW